MITEDGLLYMYFNKATYKSSTYNVVLVIDIENAKIVKEYMASTSYSYTLYLSSLLRKGGFLYSQEGSLYTFIGKDENGKVVECKINHLPPIFKNEQHRPCGSERYKIYPQNSSTWYLYDYKGGFVE